MGRVTVQIDDAVLARVRELAEAQKTTLDDMLARLLRVATMPPVTRDELPPHTRGAAGLLSGLPERPYKDLLAEALLEKYGLDQGGRWSMPTSSSMCLPRASHSSRRPRLCGHSLKESGSTASSPPSVLRTSTTSAVGLSAANAQ